MLKYTGRDFKLKIWAELPACGGSKVPAGGGGISRCWAALRKEGERVNPRVAWKVYGSASAV